MRLMIDWPACGFTLCGEASNAQEALHLIDTVKPYLLITDVKMPGMLGTDLAVIVHHYHPDTILLFFSGYRDFTFAQAAIKSQAFGYLVKPIDKEEVQQTLLEAKKELDKRYLSGQEEAEQLPILRDHVLRRIASGDLGDESLLRAGFLLKLGKGEPCYCAVITAENKLLSEGALMMLSGCGGTPFLLSPYQCGLCFKQIERGLSKLASLQDSLELSFDIVTQWSVGCVHNGTEGFGRSLVEALDATGVFFEQCGKLHLYRPADEAVSAWMLQINIPQIAVALEEDTSDSLSNELNGLCALARRLEPPLFALRCMAKALETMLLLKSTKPKQNAQFGDQLKPLWDTENMSREEWLLAFCETLKTIKTHAGVKDAYPAPVRAVLDTVGKSYFKPLTIGTIAASLNLNPAYLGQLILRYTGRTFHTLLLDTRISQACRLLKQTSQTISEIAYMVGFRDVDYFSQKFRSLMAMNPNAYRSTADEKEDAG
jgi:two-component system response regulator YesN